MIIKGCVLCGTEVGDLITFNRNVPERGICRTCMRTLAEELRGL